MAPSSLVVATINPYGTWMPFEKGPSTSSQRVLHATLLKVLLRFGRLEPAATIGKARPSFIFMGAPQFCELSQTPPFGGLLLALIVIAVLTAGLTDGQHRRRSEYEGKNGA
jgi:hypothetical protein